MKDKKQCRDATDKQVWTPMSVRYAGDVTEVIKGGGGKMTLVGGDPGEGRKQKSSG
ncbi:MAG: hypothetical protein U0Q16_39420 [Bryobacteraceae bacterium]